MMVYMDSWQQITFIPTKYYVSNKWHEGKKNQAYKMGYLNLTLTQFIKMFHSTERRGLCLMKCTYETIQVFVMFFFVF